MLARPEVQSYEYSFAGSITLVFASGVGPASESLHCAVSGASSGRGERRKIKDALLARETVAQVDDFAGRVKAKRVEFAPPAPRCPLSREG
jgi:hypothetical protein